MIDVAALKKKLADSSLIRAIDLLPKGHVRIETGFLYPDGSFVVSV
jgi:hypothetical protein